MDYGFETLAVRVADGVATISLNRPQARNAINWQLCLDLYDLEQRLAVDDAVRCVILRGEGPVFSAGADLKERSGKDELWIRERRKLSFRAYDAIQSAEKPHIALLNGPCIGGGGEIAMACDVIYGSEHTTFRVPEALWGTVGATQRLPRVVGAAYAKDMLFTGRTIDAAEAFRVGLIQRLFTAARIEADVLALAQGIAQAPALAISLAKRAVDMGCTTDLPRGIAIERLAIDRCLADGEWRKGLEAFATRKDG